MSHISAIVCTSNIAGFIFINGFSQGACTKDTPVSIPWDGNTPLFISFTPEGGNYLTTSLAFTSMNNLPICDNVELTLWTGVVEINFKPKKSVIYPPPLLPYEMQKDKFHSNEHDYSISLVDYCGVWLIIEDDESTKLCEYLDEKSSDINVDIISESPVLLHIRMSNQHWTVTYSEDKFILHKNGISTCTIKNKKLSFASDNPLLPIITDYEADDSQITLSRYLNAHKASDDKQIAIDFLAYIISDDIESAYALLSPTLQRSFTMEQIADYIGKIHTIVENEYFSQAYSNSLAVLTRKSENVNIANAYAFEIDSMKKINNIMPL